MAGDSTTNDDLQRKLDQLKVAFDAGQIDAATYQAATQTLTGATYAAQTDDGAVAQGTGTTAAGKKAVIAKDVTGPIITGDHVRFTVISGVPGSAPTATDLLVWLNHVATQLQTSSETQDANSAQALEHISVVQAALQGENAGNDALTSVRHQIALGLLNWRLPATLPEDVPAEHVLLDLGAAALWPLVVAKKYTPETKETLAQIASPEVAQAVLFARAAQPNKHPSGVAGNLAQNLAHPGRREGILRMLDDMRDQQRGYPQLTAAELVQGRMPATQSPKDVSDLVKALVAFAVGAAAGGVIGNRIDALLMKLIETLTAGRPASASADGPTASPLDSPAESASEPHRVVQRQTGIRVFDDMPFCYVPAGEFWMGSREEDKDAWDSEKPIHKVWLDAYCISRHPITVAQFAHFVRAIGYRTTAEIKGSAYVWDGSNWGEKKGATWMHPRGPGSDVGHKQDHSVTCVSWDDAQAFCRWLAAQDSQPIRLPTEAEWEKAARGGLIVPATATTQPLRSISPQSIQTRSNQLPTRRYPWGDAPPDKARCNFDMNVGDTTPVGAYPQGDSPYGCADMAGNVWEWCEDRWNADEYKRRTRTGGMIKNPTGPANGESHVVRGGAFVNIEWDARCAYRGGSHPGVRGNDFGFRVVVSPISLSTSGR
jgi:formylglycine-generating enzyme required for sulfatase activity